MLIALSEEDAVRADEPMGLYEDAPMDLADASLVVISERLNDYDVFTLGGHFRACRSRDGGVFGVIP